MPKKATITELKKDQEKLKAELEKLEAYLSKQPSKKTKSTSATTDSLLKQYLEESKKVMEKFDYLIDVLLSTTEESDEEEIEKVILTIAESQAHELEVLTKLKDLLEKTAEEIPSKEELEKFEEEQARRYNDLNQKISLLMEAVEKPSYLREIDEIRVGVSNILTELKLLESKGVLPKHIEPVKQQAVELSNQLETLHKAATQGELEHPQIKEQVNDISTKVDELEESLRRIAKMKKPELESL